jgi:hypothetical protein
MSAFARDAATQQLHNVAQARTRKLEPRVSKLTINVPLQSQFDGLDILRGADRVNPGLWNRALPIDGGTYTIKARAAGANEWSTQVTIAAENDVKTVQIPDLRNLPRDLEKPAVPPPAPAVPPPAPAVPPPAPVVPPPALVAVTARPDAPATSPGRSGNLVPFVIGGGAVALLSCGLGFELWAESNYDTAKAEIVSQSRRDSYYQSANAKRYVAEAVAVSGLVAGGAAVWLYLRGGSDREHRAVTNASVHVAPTASGVVVFSHF